MEVCDKTESFMKKRNDKNIKKSSGYPLVKESTVDEKNGCCIQKNSIIWTSPNKFLADDILSKDNCQKHSEPFSFLDYCPAETSELLCLNCGSRFVGKWVESIKMKQLICPECGEVGYLCKTGENLDKLADTNQIIEFYNLYSKNDIFTQDT